jgi:predicted anti-sigma-YlaC factor YlaD
MDCRAAQRLISAARDRALDDAEQAGLGKHLERCAGCRRMRDNLAEAAVAWRETVAANPVPDARLEWQRIQRQLAPGSSMSGRRRPALWWGVSLAAAAGLVLALWTPRTAPVAETAGLVEVGEKASATVYVDAQSGWLVVWAVSDTDRT